MKAAEYRPGLKVRSRSLACANPNAQVSTGTTIGDWWKQGHMSYCQVDYGDRVLSQALARLTIVA